MPVVSLRPYGITGQQPHSKVGRGAHIEGEFAISFLIIERIIRTITNLNATNAALFSMSGSINS